MSFENVIAFWRKVQDDAELQQQVSPLVERSDEDRCRGAAEVAQKAGFDVTVEEVRDVGRVVAFWQQADADTALQKKLEAAHAKETSREALDAISAIAKETGFELPHAALSTVTAAMVEGHDALQRGGGGLSEAELAGVVGGVSSDGLRVSYNLALNKRWAQIAKFGPGQVGAKP